MCYRNSDGSFDGNGHRRREVTVMLTPSAVANTKPRGKPYKLADERGMYLLVKPDGARWWRFDYRRPGTTKRNTLSLGTYPDVSLRQARERRDQSRKPIADGIDPGAKRKAESVAVAETFERPTVREPDAS